MEMKFQGIPGSDQFSLVEPIRKGWSADLKYYIEDRLGRRMLLRVSDSKEYEVKRQEFKWMQKAFRLGVPMAQPLEIGSTDDGLFVFMLLGWCPGEDAEAILPALSSEEQYLAGLEAGRILRRIHSIPAPPGEENWAERFNRKVDRNIRRYQACGIDFPGDEKILQYLSDNRALLNDRPQCYQHGDYHVGNMVMTPDRKLGIIDFNRYDFGDPWEEFNRIVWSAQLSPHFATGQINGYFNGTPPEPFFQLLAFYIASNTLSAIPWAIPFGTDEVTVMIDQAKDVLAWFADMKVPVPSWYRKELERGLVDSSEDRSIDLKQIPKVNKS